MQERVTGLRPSRSNVRLALRGSIALCVDPLGQPLQTAVLHTGPDVLLHGVPLRFPAL